MKKLIELLKTVGSPDLIIRGFKIYFLFLIVTLFLSWFFFRNENAMFSTIISSAVVASCVASSGTKNRLSYAAALLIPAFATALITLIYVVYG